MNKIWVDADACPVVVRDILYRAAERTGVEVTLVANQFIRTPASNKVTMLQVQAGFDVADNEIVKRCQAGDLIITSDIPLADEIITKGAHALSPRGEMFSKENIKSRLNIRDFMETMRSSGIQTGGPAPLNQADRQQFANHLDKWLVHWQRAQKQA
ncbi:YaiI/YqxD family protein [Vibrio sp. JPW-9-11-11]|uniref:YaiI/YqxD family protein n=1 Tax=Vibrio sp. JPW-9-11-11 TaxID=1416532 RepID=UPI001593D437|nr:YaiI/YqxD family protein [Vibrio sp. JPW-9-11-11]NVD08712.1 YaiI/YqxD family protein [Vibrio sp. JPW-9-11-11]